MGNYVSTDYSYYNMNNCNQMQGILLVDVSAHSIYTCIVYTFWDLSFAYEFCTTLSGLSTLLLSISSSIFKSLQLHWSGLFPSAYYSVH